MRSDRTAEDCAGLIAIKLDGAAGAADAQRVVSFALQPFAAEPLVWESGSAIARLRREGTDPTTSLRVLAAEQTLGAVVAIREAFRGADVTVTLACDLEPAAADPTGAEYWVRRQRIERLVEQAGGDTVCRRGITAARPLVLERLGVHLDRTGNPPGVWRVVPGPGTVLPVEIGRSVAPYREEETDQGHARRDIAMVASPTAATRILLVLADAWVGKSHVARQLHKALRDRRIEVWLTSFESQAPDWPEDEFLKGTSPRVWIVDAVDEAERRGVSIARLGRNATDGKSLTTVVFTRPDATLADIERKLRFSRGDSPGDDVERVKLRLLPLDERQIRRELVDVAGTRLDNLLSAAEQFDPPLTFPELRELARRIEAGESHARPDLGAIRDAVARQRCTRWREGRPARAIADDKILEAARFLAAVAAFANEPDFHFGSPLAVGFAVNRVLPAELLEGAHALQDTTALTRFGDGYRFAAAHLEEELAAGFLAAAMSREMCPVSFSAVRALLTDGQQPRPELERVIKRVREVLEIRNTVTLDEALRPFDSGEAVRRFREIVAAARKHGEPVWVPTQDQLRWLGAPLVRDDARAVLRDAQEPSSVRHLVLRAALANHPNWKELAPIAADIALSGAESPSVRQLAVAVAAEDSEQLERLRGLFGLVPRDQPDESLANLRAGLVFQLLGAGRLSPLEAARECPAPSLHVFDSRSHAITEVGSRLDGLAARAVLDQLRCAAVAQRIQDAVCDELREAAVSAFLKTELAATGDDVDRLVYVMKADDNLPFDFAQRQELRRLPDEVRRAVYRRLDLGGEYSDVFIPEKDAKWLIACAGSIADLPQNVRSDLFAGIQTLEKQGQSSAAERGREILRRDGGWEKLEAKVASAIEWEERRKEWAAARDRLITEARNTALPLENLLDTFLGDRRDASTRLHVLGDFFFGDRRAGTNVAGNFDEDLSTPQQAAIMDATWDALAQASPEPIPGGNTFSSFILDEGRAFAAAALWNRTRLDGSLVARWLPAALFAATTESEIRAEELIECCFLAAPGETVRAVADDVAREARHGYAHTHRIPAMLWGDARFVGQFISLIRRLADGGEQERKAVGGLLLDVLGTADALGAPAELRRLLEDLSKSQDAAIAKQAIGAWFRRWPEEGIERAIAATHSLDDAVAVFSPSFSWSRRDRLRPGLNSPLPARVTARLVQLLLPLVPEMPARRPWVAGRVDPEHELAEWVDDLIGWCIANRADPELGGAIAVIRQRQAYSDRLSTAEAAESVQAAVTSARRPWPTPDEVARTLRGALVLVHDVGDLARVVAEIANGNWDPSLITLLYDRADDGPPKHAYERKLQVLARHELLHGLEKVQPRVETTVVREPDERAGDQPDLVVFTTNQVPRLEVPVEIKWADNDRLVPGLTDQLGERYLGQAGRTHGIFLVGWAGKPDRANSERRLAEARDEQARKGRTIHVVWKDVRLPAPGKAS